MKLGFRTRYFTKFLEPDSKKAVLFCKKIGCNVIEFGGGPKERINNLEELEKEDLEGFKYISFHASKIDYSDRKEVRLYFDQIEEVHNRLNFDTVIIHPDNIVDWEIFKDYSFTIALENMDNRCLKFKTPDSLHKILKEHKDFKIALDINHCFVNDKTMELANDFYKKFGDRIAEFHVSSYLNKDYIHHPLFITKQIEILNFIKGKDIPIIIESEVEDAKEAEKEFNYIKNYLTLK